MSTLADDLVRKYPGRSGLAEALEFDRLIGAAQAKLGRGLSLDEMNKLMKVTKENVAKRANR